MPPSVALHRRNHRFRVSWACGSGKKYKQCCGRNA
ncbi:MAG: hypothetical protein GXW99_11830 [Clostridiales bacterium]|nr:hypothetical protein [Clostridiales bacterium]